MRGHENTWTYFPTDIFDRHAPGLADLLRLIHLCALIGYEVITHYIPSVGSGIAVPRNYDSADGLSVDVAIIGGGVAGLYAAWRLAESELNGEHGDKPRVALVEATARIGGRIETVSMPGMRVQRAEFGAMRLASWQRLVTLLAEQLGLQMVPFDMGDEHNFFYLRGRHLSASDLTDPGRVPYHLEGWELGKAPQALLDHVARAFLGTRPMPTERREWDDLKQTHRYRGRPVREYGFWNVLVDLLSPEAVHFVEDAVGFGSMTQNWSAIEALQLIYSDFGPEVSYLAVSGGTDRLTVGLGHRFTAAGGVIYCGNTAFRLDASEMIPGGVVLTISNARTGDSWQMHARHVICALPRRALELMGQRGSLVEPTPRADPELVEVVGSVHRFPAFKLFLGYEEPWWRELQITSGRSVTDLPIRQTFYFGIEESQRALLMASYDDDRSVAYWQGLGWPKRDVPSAPRLEVHGDGGPSDVLVAPPEMVRHAQAQLSRMHGIDLPTPYIAAYRNWGLSPFGGAWHLWRAGADSIAVSKRVRRPLPGQNIYICGEAYSGIQGFVEGALTSTELVLQEQLGIDPPPWLPEDYYLGPRASRP